MYAQDHETAIPDRDSITHLTWLRERIGDDLLDAALLGP